MCEEDFAGARDWYINLKIYGPDFTKIYYVLPSKFSATVISN